MSIIFHCDAGNMCSQEVVQNPLEESMIPHHRRGMPGPGACLIARELSPDKGEPIKLYYENMMTYIRCGTDIM